MINEALKPCKVGVSGLFSIHKYGKSCAITVTTTPVDTSGLANDATVEVTLATSTADAAIHYTTDGTTPTASSDLYDPASKPSITTANQFGETVTFKARGFKSGMNNSAVQSKEITFNAAATVTVENAADLTTAIETNNVTTINISGSAIDTNVTATRTGSTDFTINFGANTMSGNLNITANSVSEITFNGTADPHSIIGDLIIEATSATVNNNVGISGTATLNGVGFSSYNANQPHGEGIRMTGPGRVNLTGTATSSAIEVDTPDEVEIDGESSSVTISQPNTTRIRGTVPTITVNAANTRIERVLGSSTTTVVANATDIVIAREAGLAEVTVDTTGGGSATQPEEYRLTMQADPTAGGTLTGAGSANSRLYEEGATVTITATPSTGYDFVNWTQEAGDASTFGDADIASTTFEMPGSAATIQANFTPILVDSVSIDGGNQTIKVGETTQLTVTVGPSDALDKSVTWSSSDTGVATVDNGVVTGVAEGTTNITATSADGSGITSDPIVITVEDKEIESVETIADINVAFGTEVGDIGLPATVEVTLDDDSTETLNVTWDGGTPVYDGNTAGSYAFEGTITTPAGIANTAGHTATVNVVVAAPVPMSITAVVTEFTVGVADTFTVGTVANDDAGKMVRAHFTLPAGTTVEYQEGGAGDWLPLTDVFGPPTGFPLGDITTTFRGTFSQVGTQTVTVEFRTVDGNELLGSKAIEVTVAPDPTLVTVTTAEELRNALNDDVVVEITVTSTGYQLYNLSELAAFSRTTGVTLVAESETSIRVVYAGGQDLSQVTEAESFKTAKARGAVFKAEETKNDFEIALGSDEGAQGMTWDILIRAMYFYKEQAIPLVGDLANGDVKTGLETKIGELTSYYESLAGLDMSGKTESVFDISTGALETFTGLTVLNLSGVGLNETGGLAELTNLEELDVSNNNLTELNVLFDPNPKTSLKQLDASNNQLENIIALVQLAQHDSFSADNATWDISNNSISHGDTQSHIDAIETVFNAANSASFTHN